ncbi:YeeE/YedE family protein [Roseateles sp.]|uniref:YeeE/YedE family protein n=1 Tax=Roseateles sp. TaxID=1971397 RepID=UPI0025E5FD54|nr:YeeE/YedE family protein [Roseateles sp.]MBV8035269.1 YeeE/YedE family protein [Roseateles sp.]
MTLDWTVFTPGGALAGGLLIGGAAALLVLLGGRIAGISGILGGLLRRTPGERGWRLAFVAGLAVSPWLYAAFAAPLRPRIDAGWGLLLLAGLLVGVGTRYGAGCTSGHGVCGLSRLSWRSAVATALFMAAGFATVFVARHLF